MIWQDSAEATTYMHGWKKINWLIALVGFFSFSTGAIWVCILIGRLQTNGFWSNMFSSRGSLRGLPIFNTHPKMGVAYGTGDGLETRLGGLGASNLTEGPRPQPVATNDPFSRLEREVKKR